MKTIHGDTFMSSLEKIITLLVETQIKVEAFEQVLEETNPLIHQVYLGELQKLTEEKAVELTLALTETLMGSAKLIRREL
jgi:hypothetical protein